MPQDLSPKGNLTILTEAFLGPRDARAQHRQTVAKPITIQSGLKVIRKRWPDVRSGNQSAPVFIFSAGWRSGSTFLQRWIMTSGHVLVWGEPYQRTELIRSMAGQLRAFTHSWPGDDYFVGDDDLIQDPTSAWVANLYPSLEDFMDAHIAFLERLFLEPARALGKPRWGLKELMLTVGHARYLKWLFPNAKFLFLCRNPYDAYGSYRKWRNWYKAWPAEPVFTPTRYGAFWRHLAADFLDHHDDVGGLLLRYEKLREPATRKRLENYLGFRLAEASTLARVDGTNRPNRARRQPAWVPRLETLLLRRQVAPVTQRLGYTQRRDG